MPASVATRKKEPEKAPEEPVYKRQTYYTPEPDMAPSVQTRIVSAPVLPAEPVLKAAPAPSLPVPRKKMPVFALVVSIFLIATLAILYLNYTSQNNKIKQLRDIVTQMQQNQVTPVDQNRQLVHYRLDPEPENIKPADSGLALAAAASAEKKLPKKNSGRTETDRKSIVPPVTDSAMVAVTPPAPAAESGTEKRVSVKRDDEANLKELVSIKTNDYKTGLLGGINNLKITLYNKSLSVLKKVDVQIDYLGPESRVVKSQHVYFENVAPGEDLMLDVPKSNRGVKVNCIVKKIST